MVSFCNILYSCSIRKNYIFLRNHEYPKVSKDIRKYPNGSKSIQMYPKVSKSIQKYPKVPKSTQKYPKLFKTIQNYVCAKIQMRHFWWFLIHCVDYPLACKIYAFVLCLTLDKIQLPDDVCGLVYDKGWISADVWSHTLRWNAAKVSVHQCFPRCLWQSQQGSQSW